MQKNFNVKRLTTTAMMVALSVIIGIFCKTFLNFGQGLFRITFENLPIIIAGIVFGPITGGCVGLLSDLTSYFLSAQAYPPNLIVTLGATTVGAVSGIVPKIVRKKGKGQIILAGGIAHIVGSMIIKPIGLYQFYGILVLFRIPLYLVIAPIEIFLICVLLNRKGFAKIVGYVDKNMKKEETLNYIHSINWTFCKPGLERIQILCEKLGNPQNNLKFIHVAGTNGKGSFCSMLSSILKDAGYKVGLYTSPYIKCFNERMQINGEMIRDCELTKITEKIKPIADSMQDKPTEFELVTAIAFEYFNKHKCDYVVLECGLGGRLDSTNIITTPVLSVITGIALDHTSILGNTVEEIAGEKAGIIKENIPCLWCGDNESAKAVIENTAKKKNAPFYCVDRSTLNVKKTTLDGTFFDFDEYDDVKINLLGNYQTVNAANVLSAVSILKKQGIKIGKDNVYSGLEKARWAARFEKISESPLVIFDGGHNPEGVDSCVESVKNYFGNEKTLVITGVMKDKDYSYIAKRIGEIAYSVYCITPDNQRALEAEKYAEEYASLGVEAYGYSSVKEAVEECLTRAKKEYKAVICSGSLYMYCEIAENVAKFCKKM